MNELSDGNLLYTIEEISRKTNFPGKILSTKNGVKSISFLVGRKRPLLEVSFYF
jgi:hypothetical protein